MQVRIETVRCQYACAFGLKSESSLKDARYEQGFTISWGMLRIWFLGVRCLTIFVLSWTPHFAMVAVGLLVRHIFMAHWLADHVPVVSPLLALRIHRSLYTEIPMVSLLICISGVK